MLEPVSVLYIHIFSFRFYIFVHLFDSNLNPSTSQFMKHLLVQRLIRLLWTHRQEDVASYEFMNNFTVRRLTFENYIFFFELNHHVFHFPINVPRLRSRNGNIYIFMFEIYFEMYINSLRKNTKNKQARTFMVLYLQVFKWSPLWSSIRISLLFAIPNNSSLFLPVNRTTKSEIPYSGRDCHALM